MKAILVLDEMPTVCFDCPLGHVIEYKEDDDIDMVCEGQPYDPTKVRTVIKGDIFDINKKPSWCPLKPMPEKRILPRWEVENTNYGEEPWFSDGWNACLEVIEK